MQPKKHNYPGRDHNYLPEIGGQSNSLFATVKIMAFFFFFFKFEYMEKERGGLITVFYICLVSL